MALKTILFTKLFETRPAEQIGETAAELGFDGIDLLVRTGFTVTPENPSGIGKAVDTWKAMGLSVPNATTDMTDPADFPAEAVLGACADAGIETVRLGYWLYEGSRRHADMFDEARGHLDTLETMAERFGVTLTLQLHGGTIHSSGALALRLIEDRNPERIAAYIDPGNQIVQDGHEGWRLTFDLLGSRLRCVGVKNGGWSPGKTDPSGQRLWGSDWLGVPDGAVPWHEIIPHLIDSGYDGPLSFHGHYALPLGQVLDQTRTDLRYIRRLMGDAR